MNITVPLWHRGWENRFCSCLHSSKVVVIENKLYFAAHGVLSVLTRWLLQNSLKHLSGSPISPLDSHPLLDRSWIYNIILDVIFFPFKQYFKDIWIYFIIFTFCGVLSEIKLRIDFVRWSAIHVINDFF